MDAERKNTINEILYSSHHRRSLWTADGMVTDLRKEFSRTVPVFYMQDHDAAGPVWDAARELGIIPRGATLVHVDAHDDLAVRLPLPEAPADLSHLSYDVGAFIMPRVHAGIISHIAWVHPENVSPPEDSGQTDGLLVGTIKFPKMKAELLDIDLDYFTKKIPQWHPDAWIRARVRTDIQELLHNVTGVRVITVALSPGYIRFSQAKTILIEVMHQLRQ